MKKVITVIMVVLALTECAKATLVNSNSIIQDGVEYYLQTDKLVYELGEDVVMLYRLTNLRDEDVTIPCSRSWEFNLLVGKNGKDVWALAHWFVWYSPGVELLAGESIEIPHTWDMEDDNGKLVIPGIYDVDAVMYNEPWNYDNHRDHIPTEIKVPITIIPEPGSLALLGLGLVGLFVRSKKRKH